MHCTDMCPANKKKDLGGLSDVPNTAMYLISYFFSTFTSLSCKNRSTKHIITTSIFCSCQNRGKKIRKEKKMKGDVVSTVGKLGTWDWAKVSLGNSRPSHN